MESSIQFNNQKRFIGVKGDLLLNIISALFILLFIYTAVSKLYNFNVFLLQLTQFPIIEKFAFTLARIIPATEIGLSLLLFFPYSRSLGIYLSLALMLIFTGYISVMIIRYGKNLPCSCSGVTEKMSWGQHLIFNLFFILIATLGIVISKARSKPVNL